MVADSDLLLENSTVVNCKSKRKFLSNGCSYKVLLECLIKNTTYKYQVWDASKKVWSDVYSFTTGNYNVSINIGFITTSLGAKL